MNLEKMIDDCLEKSQNLALLWTSSDLDNKRIMQEILFPNGILYDARKHDVEPFEPNAFIEVIAHLSRVSSEKEKGTFQDFLEKSLSVARSGVEPETFGL